MKRLILLMSLLAPPVFALDELPSLGVEAAKMTRGEEKRLGQEVFTEVRRSIPLWDDYHIIDYIDSLGARLSTAAERGYQFQFFVINDMTINAFALPGGWIGIYTGMIELSESESELAAVLAHEMAHVTQRHIAQLYEYAAKVQLGSIAGLIASAVIGAYNAEAGQGALAATMAAGEQSLIHFTRENERDADRVGLGILANAGFDPNGMASVFSRMGENQRYYGSNIPPFLLTHPLSEERTRDALVRAKDLPYRLTEPSDNFAMVKARIKALAPKTVYAALKNFDNNSSIAADQYGLALAHLRNNDSEKAMKYLSKLPDHWHRKPAVIILRSDIYLSQNQDAKAISLLSSEAKNHPYNRAFIFATVNALLTQKKYDISFELLKRLGERYPNDPNRLFLLARCAANLKNYFQSVLYEIDSLVARGDFDIAEEKIRYAKTRFPEKKQQAQLEKRNADLNELLNKGKSP